MTAEQLVADLVYVNYRFQREYAPDISPERWQSVFGEEGKFLEQRYQSEVRDAG